jgi:molybdenum cofactor synthesis domain-containing protein
VIIGNEVLSGRTQDANIKHLATRLSELGLPLREVRVIPDVAETIVNTINEVRARYDHVFTTGGIGPTHDDITSECIAAAFGVPWEAHPEAMRRLSAMYEARGVEFNEARRRMAMTPRGASLIDNPVSVAPGFTIGNVHVMAGVPSIMRAMFENLVPELPTGTVVASRAVHALRMAEGGIARPLSEIAKAHAAVDIGSYPFYRADINGVAIVARGTDEGELETVMEEVRAMIADAGYAVVEGEPPA